MMTYNEWICVSQKGWNGIAVDYLAAEGIYCHEPFCCPMLEEVLSDGQI